jgi:hypothetical protein
MYDILTGQFNPSEEMLRLRTEKKSALELQERKHEDWDDNYELNRNKVKTNRLTQRQAVNIPLMKETIKTLLSRIDDPPNVKWKELGGDGNKEIVYQEIWDTQMRDNNIDLIDVLDKKNVLLYGMSFKKLNPGEHRIEISVLDPYDILIDPLTNPWDLESARFLIHQNIFKSVREILADDRYSESGKQELRIWADSPAGITQDKVNKEEWEKKMERLKTMGVENDEFGYFAGGDRLISLTEHFTNRWNSRLKKFERRVVVYAEDSIELMDELLEDVTGVNFWPFVKWVEDPETNDIYPDSVADLVRTPNKVLNVWFSQLIENRTLKNFQMHWFLPMEGYTPQTYTPGPGVMLPAPPGEDISKVIKPVEVSGLDDTFSAINALTQIVERGTGATSIEKGQAEEGVQTLGEVQILVGKANERVLGMAKFYRQAWYELAWKWSALMDANAPASIKLYKIGRSGKAYPKTVLQKDWKSEAGYEPIISSSSEYETETTKGIQKWMFVVSQFPQNTAIKKIAQKRIMELVDVTPEEMKEIEEAENETAMINPPQQAQPTNPMVGINQLTNAQ